MRLFHKYLKVPHSHFNSEFLKFKAVIEAAVL